MSDDRSPARCRRCRKPLLAEELRYIRMRVVANRWVRETTSHATDAGPFCQDCLALELDPA